MESELKKWIVESRKRDVCIDSDSKRASEAVKVYNQIHSLLNEIGKMSYDRKIEYHSEHLQADFRIFVREINSAIDALPPLAAVVIFGRFYNKQMISFPLSMFGH